MSNAEAMFVQLLPRGAHKALPDDQRLQLKMRDEDFGIPLLYEVLSVLSKGYTKYETQAFDVEDPIKNQNALAEYENCISCFNDISSTLSGYRVGWDLMKDISDVIYPLVCSKTLTRRTTSVWMTLVNRLMSIYSTKKASVVPPFTIPWRPLCDLIVDLIGEPALQAVCPSAGRDTALFDKDTLNTLVERSCRYFDDNAFGEIWEFLKPRLQRRNGEFYLGLLCGLLPVHRCCRTPEQQAVAKDVLDTLFDWSEERFNYLFGFSFQTCDIVYYIASGENVGRVDLTPYAERIFTLNLRISGLRSDFVTTTHSGFGIPQFQVGVGCAAYFSPETLGDFKNTSIASAIAFSLPNDPTNGLWNQLKRFLRACETYTCSSSSSTRQSKAVAEWIWRFTSSFVDRVRAQRLELYPVPATHQLSQETIDTFVNLMQKHVIERLYRTRGNASELICLVALSPKIMLPGLLKLINEGASSGSQTSFPQVTLSVIGLLASQASFFEDEEVRSSLRALVLSKRDWILECLDDTNGPNFLSACSALAGMTSFLPMDSLYDDEQETVLRITQSLFKLTTLGGRAEHVAGVSIMLLFLYRACHPQTLEAVGKYVVGELKSKASANVSERVFLSSLSTYVPAVTLKLYFPIFEEIIADPRSTLQEKKTHVDFFGSLGFGEQAVAISYAPRVLECIYHVLNHITSTDLVLLTGRLLHVVVNALVLPRAVASSNRDYEIAPEGHFRVFDSTERRVEWILPTAEGRALAVKIFVELTQWALTRLSDLDASTAELKKKREELGVPLYDHEEEYTVANVRRGLVRFLQLCAGDAGRLLFTAASAIRNARARIAEVKQNPSAVLAQMLNAMHRTSYTFPSGVGGAFDPDAPETQALEAELAKVGVSVLLEAFLRAASESEAADDPIGTQLALTGVHMLHGVNFSSGKSLRDFAKPHAHDPAGITRKKPMIYFVGVASAAAADIAAYMSREEVVGDRREKLIDAIVHFTCSPFVKVAKAAQDVLLLHIRHMLVPECVPFVEKLCKKNADFISAPNDITADAIAEKNLINSMVVASSLCTTFTPNAIRIFIGPFVDGTVQIRCRPTVESTMESLVSSMLSKLARANDTKDTDWLLDVIFKVMPNSFLMTPQKKLLFLDQISTLRLRRTDAGFTNRLMQLMLELMPLFHSRDQSIALGVQRTLADMTNSLFLCEQTATIRLLDNNQPKKNDRVAGEAAMIEEEVLPLESFKERLLASTRLRTLGSVVIPSEFAEYRALKLVNVEVDDSTGSDCDDNVATHHDRGDSLGDKPRLVGVDAYRWSVSRWRDWFLAVLRRLAVGDCGSSFRTLTLFISRMAMLSNFKIVPPALEACRTIFDEYRAETDSTRKRESGAVICAFSVARTIEEMLRAEYERMDQERQRDEKSGTVGPNLILSQIHADDKPAFKAFLTRTMTALQDFVEEVVIFVCESPFITTETFFEFAGVSPLDSDQLRSRMITTISTRIRGLSISEFEVSLTEKDTMAGTLRPTSPTEHDMAAELRRPFDNSSSPPTGAVTGGFKPSVDSPSEPLAAPPTSPHCTAKNLFRYFCFLVTFSSSSTYEGFTVLQTNNIAMNFLENHLDLIVRESSRSSAIAQQLVDQIGHFIARSVHFGFTWRSDAWSFTRDITARSESFIKALLTRSLASMDKSRKKDVAPRGVEASVAEGVAIEGDNAGEVNGVDVPSEVTLAAGDTCKFEVLLIIRVLSLGMTQMIQRVLPEVIDWLYRAQLWVSDDAVLADQILSLSRNIVSRDLPKAVAQSAVTQMCDLLLDVAARCNSSPHSVGIEIHPDGSHSSLAAATEAGDASTVQRDQQFTDSTIPPALRAGATGSGVNYNAKRRRSSSVGRAGEKGDEGPRPENITPQPQLLSPEAVHVGMHPQLISPQTAPLKLPSAKGLISPLPAQLPPPNPHHQEHKQTVGGGGDGRFKSVVGGLAHHVVNASIVPSSSGGGGGGPHTVCSPAATLVDVVDTGDRAKDLTDLKPLSPLTPTEDGTANKANGAVAAASAFSSISAPCGVVSSSSTLTSTLSSTRRVVLMLTAMLHRTLFLNLHRIGKFAMLQRCADAMSASLGSLTHTSKSDHKMVARNAIAVLVRVSSDEQISALINPHLEVLKRAQATEGGLIAIARAHNKAVLYSAAAANMSSGGGDTTNGESCAAPSPRSPGYDDDAIQQLHDGGVPNSPLGQGGFAACPNQLGDVKKAVHFLCAVVLAYPEQVPPFCGKILKALSPYGTAPVAEIKNAIGLMFRQWWRTHRERWEYEFKDQFTPAQQAVVLEYWSSSSYYA